MHPRPATRAAFWRAETVHGAGLRWIAGKRRPLPRRRSTAEKPGEVSHHAVRATERPEARRRVPAFPEERSREHPLWGHALDERRRPRGQDPRRQPLPPDQQRLRPLRGPLRDRRRRAALRQQDPARPQARQRPLDRRPAQVRGGRALRTHPHQLRLEDLRLRPRLQGPLRPLRLRRLAAQRRSPAHGGPVPRRPLRAGHELHRQLRNPRRPRQGRNTPDQLLEPPGPHLVRPLRDGPALAEQGSPLPRPLLALGPAPRSPHQHLRSLLPERRLRRKSGPSAASSPTRTAADPC